MDTVYFGGGTPTLLGTERLCRILEKICTCFSVIQNAEITLEANLPLLCKRIGHSCIKPGLTGFPWGFSRLLTMNLFCWGRRHTAGDAARAVAQAQKAGFNRISLDLMLAIPEQTLESISRSVSFCTALGVEHVSAYLLKIEPGTPFAAMASHLRLPDEETQCEYYLHACAQLEENGYRQYEISNFAKSGGESRHNLRYWKGQEYLGIGSSAHSFYNGLRFFYPRDLNSFLRGEGPVEDGIGGDMEEFLMLRLRLSEGISRSAWAERFGVGFSAGLEKKARQLARCGLMEYSGNGYG